MTIENYVLDFQYDFTESGNRTVTAKLYQKTRNFETTIVSSGTAICSKNDNFVKEVGRKIALKKALKNFTRDERTLIWAGYLSRNKKYISEYLLCVEAKNKDLFEQLLKSFMGDMSTFTENGKTIINNIWLDEIYER